MRFVAILAVCLALVAAPRIADACGTWDMKDLEKKFRITWVIDAASIGTDRGRLAALYLDGENKGPAVRVVANRKVIFDFAGDKLRKYNKPVATLDGDTVAFGKKVFTIELTDPSDYHGMSAWKLAVKLGDKTVIESGQAVALCAGGNRKDMVDADKKQEIRRRIAFYLAWRELGV